MTHAVLYSSKPDTSSRASASAGAATSLAFARLRRSARSMGAALLLCLTAVSSFAAPESSPRNHPDGPPAARQHRDGANDGHRGGGTRRAPHGHGVGQAHGTGHAHGDGRRWHDTAHGHGRHYPAHGHTVRALPPHSRSIFWSGVNYSFWDGVWYAPGTRGYVVSRPPFGIVVSDLPVLRTLVVIGGIAYLYANGVYYRERSEGGYEVVQAPAGQAAPVEVVTNTSMATRVFVYPRAGQSAEQQASDEYECHRWAVTQSGFDPTLAATSTAAVEGGRRGVYQRARIACLEGRNYTVR